MDRPAAASTLIARATAGECGAKFFNVAVSDVLDMYIGESERKLHASVRAGARRSAPAVLFFDESRRRWAASASIRVKRPRSKLVSQFLSELDGFTQANENVLIMGATNVPWAVDPAFRRPGRFDRVMFVPPPDRVARAVDSRSAAERTPTAGELPLREERGSRTGLLGAESCRTLRRARSMKRSTFRSPAGVKFL